MHTNYDKLFSIDTSNHGIRSDQFKHYYQYEATPYPHLYTLFAHFSLKSSDHLVDFGSGKGRLLFYTHYHFNCSVTGIEMNKFLYDLSIENKSHYLANFPEKQQTFNIMHLQAEKYLIEQTANVFYFFNPFSLHVFQTIINQIVSSVHEHPRNVNIILYYPDDTYKQYLQNETPFHKINEVRIPGISHINPKECFVIYRYQCI